MDTEKLTSILVELLPKLTDSPIRTTPAMTDPTFNFYAIKIEELESLLLFLSSQQRIKAVFEDKLMNTGSGSSQVSIELLARWLVGRSRLDGINQAVQCLGSFLDTDSTPCFQVLTISGISVKDVIHINENIELIPFDKLPDSRVKESLYPLYMRPEFILKMGFLPHHMNNGYRPPESAVVMKATARPKSYNVSEMSSSNHLSFQKLYEFCEFLTLVKKSTPVPVAAWCDLPNNTPCKELLGGGWSGTVIDVLSRTTTHLTEEDWIQKSRLYSKFAALDQNVRDLLRVPIERINQARRRSNPVDKAIDLGVACEALFLSDKQHNEQLSFILRLRAALFLGESVEQRKKLLRFFSSLYSCRSQAAHSGKLDAKVKIAHRGHEEVTKVLDEADTYCVEAICKIIEQGKTPDWELMMLESSNKHIT